jgi:HK97 family phage major capsid protein
MELAAFLAEQNIIPVSELTTLATDRRCFGDDVITAFARQVELRSAAAQGILSAAESANRDQLLASEQRGYDSHMRERDALLSLQQAVERRTAERGFVPATQAGTGTAKPERRGIFGTGVEFRALVTTSGAGAVVAPDQYGPGFFDRLAPLSVILRAGAQVLRTERDVLHLPRVDTDPTSAIIAEGNTITPSDPGYTDVAATPAKFAGITVVSNELMMDSSPDITAMLEMQLLRSLALKYDLACFEETTAFKGFKNVVGITLDSSLGAAGSTPADLDTIAGAIGQATADNANPSAIFMHPRSWATLLQIKEATGSTKSLLQDSTIGVAAEIRRAIFGLPVYLSSQLSITETKGASTDCSSIYIVDMSQVYAVFRTDARVEVDRSRLFNTDQSEVRGIMRATLACPNAKAIVRIEGVRNV